MKTGGGADDESHEEGYHQNPRQGEDSPGFHVDEVGYVLIMLNKKRFVCPRDEDGEHEGRGNPRDEEGDGAGQLQA